MSEYKGIKGFQVTTRTEDPTPFAQALANNPYAGSWASGGNLNTARTYSGASGLGTQTDSIIFGGRKNSSPASNKDETEKYNGTSWQSVKTSNTTMVAGEGYFVDTSSAAITMTLPSSTTQGDEISIIDYAGTFDTNNLTVGRNSHKIQGSAADLTVSTERAGFTLVYVDSTQGWLLKDK